MYQNHLLYRTVTSSIRGEGRYLSRFYHNMTLIYSSVVLHRSVPTFLVRTMSQVTNETLIEVFNTKSDAGEDCISLFAAEERRLALEAIKGTRDGESIRDIARWIATQQLGREPPDPEMVNDIVIGLHHIHLPLLDEFGLISYDPDAHDIEQREVI